MHTRSPISRAVSGPSRQACTAKDGRVALDAVSVQRSASATFPGACVGIASSRDHVATAPVAVTPPASRRHAGPQKLTAIPVVVTAAAAGHGGSGAVAQRLARHGSESTLSAFNNKHAYRCVVSPELMQCGSATFVMPDHSQSAQQLPTGVAAAFVQQPSAEVQPLRGSMPLLCCVQHPTTQGTSPSPLQRQQMTLGTASCTAALLTRPPPPFAATGPTLQMVSAVPPGPGPPPLLPMLGSRAAEPWPLPQLSPVGRTPAADPDFLRKSFGRSLTPQPPYNDDGGIGVGTDRSWQLVLGQEQDSGHRSSNGGAPCRAQDHVLRPSEPSTPVRGQADGASWSDIAHGGRTPPVPPTWPAPLRWPIPNNNGADAGRAKAEPAALLAVPSGYPGSPQTDISNALGLGSCAHGGNGFTGWPCTSSKRDGAVAATIYPETGTVPASLYPQSFDMSAENGDL